MKIFKAHFSTYSVLVLHRLPTASEQMISIILTSTESCTAPPDECFTSGGLERESQKEKDTQWSVDDWAGFAPGQVECLLTLSVFFI